MPRKAPYGVQRHTLNIYHAIPTGTGAVEIVTDWVAGFAYTIESVKAYVAVAGTGAGATRTYRVLKGASTVAATRTLALADTATVGAEVAFTVTPANASFSDTDTLTVDFASGGTAFTAGAVNLVIVYREESQRVRD
ncbi:MAG: hypothetical protein MUE61_08430 [Vicinamibacterales bacterium]|jgi:hypothetical protein|nr:hypothetical protein [Vicinamibacterales bacterium]MCU0477190.1 hypothetical protein [Chloroflexota bacterium]MCU0562338.1 hypothetical protein [Desulfobacterales bacterium]